MDSILGTVTDKLDRFLPGAKQQVKQLADKAKAYMNNMTDLEIKVMEATNHEPCERRSAPQRATRRPRARCTGSARRCCSHWRAPRVRGPRR